MTDSEKKFISLDKGESELIISRSKFLAKIFYIKDELEAKKILESLKKEFFDATHICFAYIIDENLSAFSDDGEPSGTAGSAILQILKKCDYRLTLAVSIRYFGGVKLGVGGLKRAYSDSVLLAIQNADRLNFTLCNAYQFSLDFSLYNKLNKSLSNIGKILNLGFTEDVCVDMAVPIGYDFESFLSPYQIKPKLLKTLYILE